jgi:uncharacterized protein (TIGR02271 family)
MTGTTEAYDFRGRTLIDRDGEKIGKIDELYTDEQGGHPEWALVNTGLFGTKKTFVPIRGASPDGEELTLSVSKQQVKDAPRVEADEELSENEERRLFEHYNVSYTTEGSTTATSAPGSSGSENDYDAAGQAGDYDAAGRSGDYDADGHTGRDTSGPNTDDAMTRSEEELRVRIAERESGRLRLRKYVVTETVHTTVPVQREEVRVEREPITDENRDHAMAGADISDEEHEVILHEEEPVVEKRAVPKERVRLGTETREDEREISEEVRKEQIDVDDSQSRQAR